MTAVTAPSDALRRLLDLLASGASTEQLAHVVVAARAEGALGAADLTALANAGELALRIRETLAEHRRREAQLVALFDTASELAGLSEPDTVLRSIVRRARALLGVDVSYLSLNNEAEGKTYIRVSDGSVSAEFQQIVLGMGEGLGGLVAQTARPYSTADYFTDERFRHTRHIDSGVKDEGLTAILGVPLAIGSKVLGVLFASDRSAREFSADEVALLSSLADHAAIALDSANLLDQTRRAVAELNEANATIRAHNEAMERAEDAHDRLTDLVLRGGDLPDVAAAVAGVLRGALTVFDTEGAVLAHSADPARHDPAALAASRAAGRAVPTVSDADSWVCSVQAGPELLGSLVLTGRADLADPDRRLFERAGCRDGVAAHAAAVGGPGRGRGPRRAADRPAHRARPKPARAARPRPTARHRPRRAARGAGRARRRRLPATARERRRPARDAGRRARGGGRPAGHRRSGRAGPPRRRRPRRGDRAPGHRRRGRSRRGARSPGRGPRRSGAVRAGAARARPRRARARTW